jgi:DNA-binding transcriptional ArsR family regulator
LSQDPVGPVFAALADPTRRWIVETLTREGRTSVPALTAALPITRQAVAKHLATLDDAGLVERAPGAGGREVSYRLRPGALSPAASWLRDAEAAWDGRLTRLKQSVERRA